MAKNSSDKTKQNLWLEFYSPKIYDQRNLNMYSHNVPAGFPSPAEDFLEKRLDLNEYLIKNKSATFLIKVNGDSMVNAGIFDGDILVIDRSVEPCDNKIVLGILNGEFTVKRIKTKGKKLLLIPESENYSPIEVTNEMEFQIWGVVTYAIHKI